MENEKIEKAISETISLGRSISPSIPFNLIIQAISGFEVIPLSKDDPQDRVFLQILRRAVSDCADDVLRNPIVHTRPNEVGNYIEKPLQNHLRAAGLEVEPPAGAGGAQTSGYPDILVRDQFGRYTYLEVKTYKPGSETSPFRSFYLSPSDTFKVAVSARHLLVAFRMRSDVADAGRRAYSPEHWSVRDLSKLECSLKLEFQSSNKVMYRIKPDLAG